MAASNLTNQQQSELDIPSYGKAATGPQFFLNLRVVDTKHTHTISLTVYNHRHIFWNTNILHVHVIFSVIYYLLKI